MHTTRTEAEMLCKMLAEVKGQTPSARTAFDTLYFHEFLDELEALCDEWKEDCWHTEDRSTIIPLIGELRKKVRGAKRINRSKPDAIR